MDWTDERLQERLDSIDRRFDEVDRRIDGFERRVDKRFDRVDGELKGLDAKFDGLRRTLMETGGGIIATLIAGIVTVVATQL